MSLEKRVFQLETELAEARSQIDRLTAFLDDLMLVRLVDRYGEISGLNIRGKGKLSARIESGQWQLLSQSEFDEGLEAVVKTVKQNPVAPHSIEARKLI